MQTRDKFLRRFLIVLQKKLATWSNVASSKRSVSPGAKQKTAREKIKKARREEEATSNVISRV